MFVCVPHLQNALHRYVHLIIIITITHQQFIYHLAHCPIQLMFLARRALPTCCGAFPSSYYRWGRNAVCELLVVCVTLFIFQEIVLDTKTELTMEAVERWLETAETAETQGGAAATSSGPGSASTMEEVE